MKRLSSTFGMLAAPASEVLFVDDLVRVCGDPVDDWLPVRFLSTGFNCDLQVPDAPGAVCSSG